MARRLLTIAKWINENLPELRAHVEEGHCNTDRKIGRLRWPGKGRTGNQLLVYRKVDKVKVLDHNSAETYRSNAEVEYWLDRWVKAECTEGCYTVHNKTCVLYAPV